MSKQKSLALNSNFDAKAVALLCVVYFLLRLIFQQFDVLKSAFIYPTGLVVSSFFGLGNYADSEWIYQFQQTRFVLDESCSGTTFFSLLFAYAVFQARSVDTLWVLFTSIYPFVILVNSIRVLSVIYIYSLSHRYVGSALQDEIHVVTGSVIFLSGFLLFSAFIKNNSKTQ